MIGSLLIANRGEIACRIIRTARRLGIRTIAIYSEADAGAPHVREADRALLIGPSPARDSYLAAEKIIDAALVCGAEAIHPGYGFLSENAEFAEAVTTAGLVWVGPPPAAIRAMGLKDAAKRLMAKAGVPTTPGYLGDDQADAQLQRAADRIGYPVLIKAVAGGGGKGMRRVDSAGDFQAALASCRREATASFGDDRVLLEKYVAAPRHIEVQIFADRHGNVVHLFERDCSIQRRHQKVIEEAPAPGIDEATRAAICAAAVRAAAAVAYENAGTVEFIADASAGLRPDRIWFMEMNTRLQVEHPVTELVTGQDLVEWQLRVASGDPLPLRQEELQLSGHAIEARLYAENPATGFLPSTGPLRHFRLPQSIRVDAGAEEGSAVTPFYDPMIAKLIAHGSTRSAAASQLADACRSVEAWPVKTNAAFLARVLDQADFVAGHVDTGFIDKRLEPLLAGTISEHDLCRAAAAALLAEQTRTDPEPASPWSVLAGFRLNAPRSIDIRLQTMAGPKEISLSAPIAAPLLSTVVIDGQAIVFAAGEAHAFAFATTREAAESEGAAEKRIIAPMPGRVIAVEVKAGDHARKGQVLVVLEAMKMEYALKSPSDAEVAHISVGVGDQVTEGTVLAELR